MAFPGRLETQSQPRIEAVRLPLYRCRSAEWNAFAERGDASFRCARDWLLGSAVKSWLTGRRLQLFEFYQSGQKVGQCAIGIGRHERVFLDRFALKPGFEERWAECTESILRRLGPGRYRYGWELNAESSREVELRALSGVMIESIRPLTVQVVEFSRWKTWDDFWNSTSKNTRRNARSAEQSELPVTIRTGLACLLDLTTLNRLRATMYARKGVQFERLLVLATAVINQCICARHALTGLALSETRPLAGFMGFEFGADTYYMAGGSLRDNKGAAWYLQKRMLQRAWDRSRGRGRFVMGYVDYALHDEAVGGGLLRSRRALNVSDRQTSIVVFLYQAPSGRAEAMHRGE